MPLVEVSLAEGRTPAQIRSLISELHGAVLRALDAPPENVRVIVREVPLTHWAAGDVTLAERRAPAAPGRPQHRADAG
jgi:4-oxalocrotonate tautomerase